MFNIKTLTVQEIAALADKIALKKGEGARAKFINQIFKKYHLSRENKQ